MEECGYEVNIEDIRRVRAFRTGVGVTGSLHTMFYTEVNDEMKVSEGGGIQGEEDIEPHSRPHVVLVREGPASSGCVCVGD